MFVFTHIYIYTNGCQFKSSCPISKTKGNAQMKSRKSRFSLGAPIIKGGLRYNANCLSGGYLVDSWSAA